MRKSTSLVILAGSSTVFLVFQFYFLNDVLEQRSDAADELHFAGSEHKEHEIHTAFQNIKRFLNVCNTHNLRVFLIDPIILSRIANRSFTRSESECRILCPDKKLITFGVQSIYWNDHDIIMKKFQDNHFQYMTFHEFDPRLQSIDKSYNISIPTHYFFEYHKHVIHLVVFYERSQKFLWHGAITFNATQKRWLQKRGIGYNGAYLKYGAHAGAYDRIEPVAVEIDGLHMHAPRYPSQFLGQISQSRFTECNFTRAKMFKQQFSESLSEENLLFKRKAKKLLLDGKKFLDALGVRFWLSSGTCLGWFRQCDIISYSKDVDFGIWIKDYNPDIISTFTANDMPLKHLFGKVSDSYELSFTSEDIKLDMFFFYEEKDHMWNGGTQYDTGKKFKYYFPKFSLCWTEFLGVNVRVPCETEAYIEANYGPDWAIPVASWDWKRSPPNVRYNGEWLEREWQNVIQVYE